MSMIQKLIREFINSNKNVHGFYIKSHKNVLDVRGYTNHWSVSVWQNGNSVQCHQKYGSDDCLIERIGQLFNDENFSSLEVQLYEQNTAL